MIKFDNVSVSFSNKKGQLVNAVKNVSFDIEDGEILGIVGTSAPQGRTGIPNDGDGMS